MDYLELWNELTMDPAGIGYLDPLRKESEQRNTELINAPIREQARNYLTANEFWEALSREELLSLKDANLRMYEHLRLLPQIDMTIGSQSRSKVDIVFPPSETTGQRIANILEQTTNDISRAQELGFGRVNTSDMKVARERYGN